MAPKEIKDLSTQLNSLLDLGFIWQSVSTWEALVLFVTKKKETLQICNAHHKLNKVRLKNFYPLSCIDDFFN